MPILRRSIGSHPLLRLENPASGAWVEVLPTRGGTVHQIALPGSDGIVRPLLQPMRTDVEVSRQRWAKGAQLAPWPNRIQDAVYAFQGREYHPFKSFRSQGGHAMHGTVMHETFEERPSREGALCLELLSEGWQGYPWSLRTELVYRVGREGFSMELTIENRSDSDAPVGHGWHPYFTVGRDVRQCRLSLPAGNRLGMTERSVPDGTRSRWERFRTPELVGPDFLNDCIELDAGSGTVAVRLQDPDSGRGVEVWQEAGAGRYAYVQVFTHPRRHCLAVEPMTCAPNAFNNGMGLVALPSGGRLASRCGVRAL